MCKNRKQIEIEIEQQTVPPPWSEQTSTAMILNTRHRTSPKKVKMYLLTESKAEFWIMRVNIYYFCFFLKDM